MPSNLDDLEAAVLKMRALGVTKWNGIELGPEPAKADDADQPSGQQAVDPVKALAEKRRIASLASGGPVFVGGRPQQQPR